MALDTQQRQRRSIRLKEYDYSQEGAYFVTICTHKKMSIFENEHISAIVEKCWLDIPVHFPAVQLDEWVIMPNHMHGIIIIADKCKATKYYTNSVYNVRRGDPAGRPYTPMPRGPSSNSIGAMVGQFKSLASKRINALRRKPDVRIWQSNYYEHVIRNEHDLNDIRQYILDNPVKWDTDENNLDRQIGNTVKAKPPGELLCQPK